MKIGNVGVFVIRHNNVNYAVIENKALFGNLSINDTEEIREEVLLCAKVGMVAIEE